MKYLGKLTAALVLSAAVLMGQGAIPNGGFEGTSPNYFSSGGTSATAVASWATDESRTGGHSLKIVKTNTDSAAYWKSEDLYRYWSVFVSPYVGMQVGAWVKIDNVNTSPASESEKVQLHFNFLNEAGINMLGGPLIIDIPQTVDSTGWVEVKSIQPLSFAQRVQTITASLYLGKDATGIAWVDDFFIRNTVDGEWAGDFFAPNVDTPTGWFYWWPDFSAGKAVWDTAASWKTPSFAGQDTSVSRTGDASLKMHKDSTGYEIVVNSDITDFDNDGFALTFSAYVKTLLPGGMATTANADPAAAIGFTVTWHDGTGGADGWGEVKGDDFRFTLAGDTTTFTEYTWTVTPPVSAKQYSLRARYWHNFVGTTWWDDFTMTKETRSTNLLSKEQGGFEGTTPNYFKSKDDSSTATMSWATDESRTGGHSIKIVKTGTNGEASWEADDLYRYWSAGAGTNVGMEVGAWVKLSGVNTSPANDAAKIQLVFNFLDEDGVNLAGGPISLDVPQTAATADWVEVKSAAPISFPVRVDDISCKLLMGTSATGTVWLDDFFIRNTTEGEWAGDFFSPNVDTPEGWFYWWPDFSAGKAAWGTAAWSTPSYAGQDTNAANVRSGNASLKIQKDSTGYEIVVNSDFQPFVNDGRALEFSAYVKTNLPTGMADSANADPSSAMGFTVTWHDATGGADGWGEVKGADYRFTTIPGDVSAFTKYTAILSPPEKATQFSLRARNWHNFLGTTWWDDFEVVKIDSIFLSVDRTASLPGEFKLSRVYPNPFNPVATIPFAIPHQGLVNIRVYDLLGREVAQLMNGWMAAGTYNLRWNAVNNNGVPMASGIYLVRAQFDNGNAQVQKITFLK